jgi:SAM-dependent methyltransferase
MPDAVARFAGFAAEYDAARPHPPAELAEVLMQWSGTKRPDVVDLGAGSGLSAAVWAGRARRVVAVEPGAKMRAVAMARLGLAGDAPDDGGFPDAGDGTDGTRFAVMAGSAEQTGLPDGCADIVTASQAMHWFDPSRALPEIVRILRPGGVFAAYDCDWPPCIDWATDAAFAHFFRRTAELEAARGLSPARQDKDGHLGRIAGSGLFRFATEIAVHSQEPGDQRRLADLAWSWGSAQALAAAGVTEDEMGLTALREVAARTLAEPRTWWWTYRIRMGVK